MINVGDKAPEVLGINEKGEEIRLSAYKGKKIVLYFYPKDNTSGCTAEACSLRDGYAELRDLGYEIIGISKDSAASHAKFASKHSLPFLLLSDPEGKVNSEFGVWQLKKMCGREYMGTVRTTFVTDAAHVITHIIKKVDTKNAAAQLLDIVK